MSSLQRKCFTWDGSRNFTPMTPRVQPSFATAPPLYSLIACQLLVRVVTDLCYSNEQAVVGTEDTRESLRATEISGRHNPECRGPGLQTGRKLEK